MNIPVSSHRFISISLPECERIKVVTYPIALATKQTTTGVNIIWPP